MLELLGLAAVGLVGLYLLAGFGDALLGQPRTSSGNFGRNRTTQVEDAVKLALLAAAGITVLVVLV
jgi:hypothetical protein